MTFKPSSRPARSAENPDGAIGAAADDTIPVTPTVTHYQQLADRVNGLIDEIVAVLPPLETPHPTTAGFVRSHLNLPVAFLEAAVAGVANKKQLQALDKLDVMFGRDTLQLNQAFRPIIDKLFQFAENVEFTLNTRVALLGADALQIYYLTKGLGRDPGGADMLQLADVLKQHLGRRGPRRSQKPEPPQAVIAPPAALAAPIAPSAAVPVTEPAPAVRKRRVRGKEVAPAETTQA